MKPGYVLNPIDEYVSYVKASVKDNGGYCIYVETKGNKQDKCDKRCRNMDSCPCGMYIKENE